MVRARTLLICSLLAVLAACRTEVPRQSLKDHVAAAPAAAVRAPAAVAAPAPAARAPAAVAAPLPAPAATPVVVPAPPPLPAPTPAAAAVETDQPKDQLSSRCWDRYRDYLIGETPKSFEEKLSADGTCRLIICPTCPR